MNHSANSDTFRNYLFFWVAQIVSLLGSAVLQFVIIWWIVISFENPLYLSLAYLLGIGVQVIAMPVAGVFVDRWNRKIVLGVSDGLQAIGAILFIIVFTFENSLNVQTLFWFVLLILAFRGVTSSFHATAAHAIVPIMVPRNYLHRLNGIQFIFVGVINIIGPAVGAVLYVLLPMNIIFWIDIITFGIALIPLLIIFIPPIEKNGEIITEIPNNSFITEFKEGISILRAKRGLLPLIVTIALINFIEIPIIVLGPIFVYKIHDGTALNLAMVLASSQMGLLLSGVMMLFKKEWKRKTLVIMIALYLQVAGYFLQVITPIGLFWFMSIGAFIFGATLPISNSLYRTILQVVIPPEAQGRVSSITSAAAGSIMPIAMLTTGPLADLFGFVELFMLSIITGCIVLTYMWFFTDLRSLDRVKLQEMPDIATISAAVPDLDESEYPVSNSYLNIFMNSVIKEETD